VDLERGRVLGDRLLPAPLLHRPLGATEVIGERDLALLLVARRVTDLAARLVDARQLAAVGRWQRRRTGLGDEARQPQRETDRRRPAPSPAAARSPHLSWSGS